MRILFMTQGFEPMPVYKGLRFAKALQAAGHEVEVVSAFPGLPPDDLYPGYKMRPIKTERIDGIRVTRLPLYRSHDASGLRRSLTLITYFLSCLLWGLFNGRRFDVIYAYHPPITIGMAAVLFGGLHKVPVAIDVLDLWPEGVAASGMASPWMVKLIGRICDFAYRHATLLDVPTEGYREALIERGVPREKIELVYTWAQEDLTVPRGTLDLASYRLEGRFNIVYGGNLGRLQALHHVIHAARRASESIPEIHLVLIGGGMESEQLAQLAAEVAPGIVDVFPTVSQDKIADLFAAADVLLTHLAEDPVFERVIPSKTLFYMACGKPVLAGLAGEGAALIRSVDAGLVAAPGDVDGLAEAMVRFARMDEAARRAYGERGRTFYYAHMSSKAGTDKTLALLERAVALGEARRSL